MNVEWIITGIILLGGMTAGGISLYLKRRKAQISDSSGATEIQPDLDEPKKR